MAKSKGRSRFPWIAVILLLAATYALWFLPHQLGNRPVEVEFAPEPAASATP